MSEEYLRFEQDSLLEKIASGYVMDLFTRNNMKMDEVHTHTSLQRTSVARVCCANETQRTIRRVLSVESGSVKDTSIDTNTLTLQVPS